MKYFLLNHIGVPLIITSFKLIRRTFHSKWTDRTAVESLYAQQRSFIFAFWHCEMLACAHFGIEENKHNPIAILTSLSRDGQILARTMKGFNLQIIKGSSSRGAVSGLVNMKKSLDAGINIAVAVDGPRGPRCRVKSGVILLAKAAQSPILPVAIHVSRKIVLNSWDKSEVPLPFSHCTLHPGKPIFIPKNADKLDIERKKKELEFVLHTLKDSLISHQ